MPLAHLVALIPRLNPRAFSVANPPIAQSSLELCVALVKYRTRYGRTRNGVASGWVRGLEVGASVPLWLAPGSFPPALVADVTRPLILVGPGTGVAPMRSIALARAQSKSLMCANDSGDEKRVPNDMLFFGCRHRDKDWLFPELSATPGLSVHLAFSRDQQAPDGGRAYVTHSIRAAASEVWAALAAEGSVFVSGSAGAMPRDVRAALQSIASSHGGMNEIEATEFIRRLERQQRICVETYS